MSPLSSISGHVQRASTACFVRLARHQAHRRPALQVHVRWLADVAQRKDASLAIPSEARHNEVGVQQLSAHVFEQIFPGRCTTQSQDLVELSRDHLQRHDLLGRNTDTSGPIAFDLPRLEGRTLDEHFYKLGSDASEPYLAFAKIFAGADCPPKPTAWVRRSGWTKYYPDGQSEAVDAPEETMLCFDTEVLYKQNPFAIMACASSPTAWYAWLSPWLLSETTNERQLIPLGDPTKHRIIVGHNVGFDRARILEEYDIKQSNNAFFDTMSLHAAVNGMCSRQRPTWMKYRKTRELAERSDITSDELAELYEDENEELWLERSSVNSLRDVAKFHLNLSMEKTTRNDFGELDRDGILAKLDSLLDYCANDVDITHRIYQKVFPNFLEVCPHPVSFAALRHISSVILPVNRSWDAYLANAEATYNKLSEAVQERLIGLAEKALALKNDVDQWQNDPWMKQLDWSGQEIRMTKGTAKKPPRPVARQKKPGQPQWYRNLFPSTDSPINISVRIRIAPILLRLCWDGHPLFWSDRYGWTFRVPRGESDKYTSTQMIKCEFDEKEASLRDDQEHDYFKLPHKDGPTSRCTNPMAKSYLSYFEKGILSSEYAYAKEALEMNSSCSYWISARDRIMSQMVVYKSDLNATERKEEEDGFILPQIIPMGTITRRSVEKTWLTASNANKNRVGSELKAMVKAPDGYCFVGADVDSQELWIASLVGDSTFKLHGGNAIGFMTLEGVKAEGTDMHSRTASILGITRNDAKVFNYGRIYGAGLKFATTLLRQFNPELSEKQANAIAGRLYANTKGTKTTRRTIHPRTFWRGGTESFVFNKLEELAEQERPRTFVLGAGITEALMSRNLSSRGGYLTSRINWAIQSSGVDYLHLLIVSMDFLVRRYNINARLALTVHDEIRYVVKAEDKYRAAMALQVANLWTRAMFSQQVGIDDLPQSCAFFSAIDIDHVLRKEVDMDCITPSHLTPLPPGESLDIFKLLDKGQQAFLDPGIVPEEHSAPRLDDYPYSPRTPVMQALQDASSNQPTFIKAQILNDDKELADLIQEVRKTRLATTPKQALKQTIEKAYKPTKLVANVLFEAQPHQVLMEESMSVSEALQPKHDHDEVDTGEGASESARNAQRQRAGA
ncbi:DNA-directed DNA polymerase gamma mip1 [Claviceps sp. LM77 group G4]|nr:DNA-directed DNA polymerase gamma mip1 [Claviceps sp. LM77 group G4]KAG6071200.1 DNA-directed DNA polymerase gamma mip1 [Claviceps sp. LM78 group G4]KAG6074301.1 DNA-directed DNA polymerase gamma mip1 [Claviceps sp. LM84 group G4]